MTVYVVMQSEKLLGGKPVGHARVRGIFSTREKAEKHIGPQEEKYILCKECGHECRNKAADLDPDGNPWKKKLFIQKRTMDE